MSLSNHPSIHPSRKAGRMTPNILTENYDLSLGGHRRFEAWFNVGAETPVECVVAQRKVDQKNFRWFAAAFMATPAWLAGQAQAKQLLLTLAKSDMSVRENTPEWGEDEYLQACRDDANLLAERAATVLGAVKMPTARGRKAA